MNLNFSANRGATRFWEYWFTNNSNQLEQSQPSYNKKAADCSRDDEEAQSHTHLLTIATILYN